MIVIALMAAAAMLPPSPAAAPAADTACIVMAELAGRRSPLDSVTIASPEGAGAIKFCYGRPSARGRTMLGGRLPFGRLWRTGANEPTMLHTTAPIELAGVRLQPGSYSFYTVPGERKWLIVLNRSTSQWGHTRYYTGEVAEQEIARAPVAAHRSEKYVETLTIEGEVRGTRQFVILKWENFVVEIPVRWAPT